MRTMQISRAKFARCSVANSLFAADCGVLLDTPRAYKWDRQTAFDTERAG